MIYDIYFHNDFDGRACAAVMLAFLRSRGDDIEHFTPVNYYLLEDWLDEKFFEKHKLFRGRRNPPIIVDFLYHPAAAWWFEHHPTTFKKPEWEKRFRADRQHRLEPQYPSCCHLVCAALQKDFAWKAPRHISELVKWLDVIDGAQYKSAKQTIELKEPALRVNEYIERQSHTKAENAWLVKALSERPLASIANEPKVKQLIRFVKEQDKKGIAFYKKHATVVGRVCYIDRTDVDITFAHYTAQYVFPKAMYFVRLSDRDGQYHVNVGINPWPRSLRRRGLVHVGNMLKPFKGGGHEGVGGVEFKTRKEAEHAAKVFIETINNARPPLDSRKR
ncbi:MAG TPA: hypothetical protein VMU07_02415 [Candidatus Paceibacterota bacterium]|nr:hypothetical protein [Candidatus Paceibacterota bacterium]